MDYRPRRTDRAEAQVETVHDGEVRSYYDEHLSVTVTITYFLSSRVVFGEGDASRGLSNLEIGAFLKPHIVIPGIRHPST